jgi:hypothetical protein
MPYKENGPDKKAESKKRHAFFELENKEHQLNWIKEMIQNKSHPAQLKNRAYLESLAQQLIDKEIL